MDVPGKHRIRAVRCEAMVRSGRCPVTSESMVFVSVCLSCLSKLGTKVMKFPGKSRKSLEIRMSSTRNSDIRKASANEISTHRFKEPYRVFSSRQREESGVRSQEMKETALINCEQNDCGQS